MNVSELISELKKLPENYNIQYQANGLLYPIDLVKTVDNDNETVIMW